MEEKLSTECLRIDRCQMSMHILCEQLWRLGEDITISGASIAYKDAWVSRGYRSLGYVSRVVCAVWTSACMVSYKINGAPPPHLRVVCKSNPASCGFSGGQTSDLWCHPYVPHYEATAQWSGHSNFPVNAALLLEKMMLMDQTDGLLSTW